MLNFFLGVTTGIVFMVSYGVVYFKMSKSENTIARIEKSLPELNFQTLSKDCMKHFDFKLNLESMNGLTKEISSDNNNKILFINFWATWCVPCIAEMKSIENLRKLFANEEEIEFFLISLEDIEPIKKFMEKRKYELLFYSIDKKELMNSLFFSELYPITYIISPENKLALKHEGLLKWDSEEVIQLIKSISQ